jgi:hypothetical protein
MAPPARHVRDSLVRSLLFWNPARDVSVQVCSAAVSTLSDAAPNDKNAPCLPAAEQDPFTDDRCAAPTTSQKHRRKGEGEPALADRIADAISSALEEKESSTVEKHPPASWLDKG